MCAVCAGHHEKGGNSACLRGQQQTTETKTTTHNTKPPTHYTTVDPKQFVFFKIETRACDVQSWEINVKDCKAETDTAVQSGGTHLKKEVTSPNSKPFGELFFKREHDAGHAAESAGS